MNEEILNNKIKSDFTTSEMLQTYIDCIDDIVAICDSEKTMIMMNKTACTQLKELVGLEREEMLGYKVDEVLKPFIYDGKSLVALVAEQKKALRKNVRYKFESKNLKMAGRN